MNPSHPSQGGITLLLFWRSCLGVGAATAALCAGCSCRREPPRAAWDAGLPSAATEAAPQEVAGTAETSGTPDAGTGRGVEALNAGEGGDGDAGAGKGDAGANGDGDTAQQGDGSDERGNAGDSTAEHAEGGGGKSGPTARATSPGRGRGKEAGLDNEPKPQEPQAGVFPGRDRKPHLDAMRAIQVAEAALAVAERERGRGRLPEAYDQARAAFEAVRPHAEADRRCHELADRALKVVRDIEKRIDTRAVTVRPAPTVFE